MRIMHRQEKASEPVTQAALQRWATRMRERSLEDKLDSLVTVLDRLVAALERKVR